MKKRCRGGNGDNLNIGEGQYAWTAILFNIAITNSLHRLTSHV